MSTYAHGDYTAETKEDLSGAAPSADTMWLVFKGDRRIGSHRGDVDSVAADIIKRDKAFHYNAKIAALYSESSAS